MRTFITCGSNIRHAFAPSSTPKHTHMTPFGPSLPCCWAWVHGGERIPCCPIPLACLHRASFLSKPRSEWCTQQVHDEQSCSSPTQCVGGLPPKIPQANHKLARGFGSPLPWSCANVPPSRSAAGFMVSNDDVLCQAVGSTAALPLQTPSRCLSSRL